MKNERLKEFCTNTDNIDLGTKEIPENEKMLKLMEKRWPEVQIYA